MQNVISLTHATDIDGVGSAALIRMKYGIPLGRMFFADYSLEVLAKVEKEVKDAIGDGTTLIIADLAVNDRTMPYFMRIVKSVKARNGRVFWFDHHPWSENAERLLAGLCDVAILGENERYCGAEITRIELGVNSRFAKDFCRIVHYSDFNIRPKAKSDYETIGYYALSIASYHLKSHENGTKALRHIAYVISRGKLLDKTIKDDARRFRRMNDREVGKMLRNVYLSKDMAVGFAGHVQKTYACMKLIEKTGKDIGIYVNLKDGRGHMRSIKSDVSKLAGRFHGGGHVHAAGFSPDFRRYNGFKKESDRRRFVEDLQQAADRLRIFSNVNGSKKGKSSRKPMFN